MRIAAEHEHIQHAVEAGFQVDNLHCAIGLLLVREVVDVAKVM